MATKLTYSSDSCECFSLIAVLPSNLDKGSAIFYFPEILKLYGWRRKTHHSTWAQGLERGPYILNLMAYGL